VFYYADEFDVSWLPTLRALWSPRGQQVMIPTPGQPTKHYGLGAVNYHTGETEVIFRKRKRRKEIAELLQRLVEKHPTGTIFVAWDNASTHEDEDVEAVVRAAAGRLSYCICPPIVPGSIRLSIFGGSSAAK
jgi:putative transposase